MPRDSAKKIDQTCHLDVGNCTLPEAVTSLAFILSYVLSGLRAQTSTLERFLASVDLSRGENILNIREYSREYRWPGENISKRI